MERKNQEISNGDNGKFEIPEEQRQAERAKAEDLKERLSSLKNRDTAVDRMAVAQKIADFANLLKEKYKGKVDNYILFHILVGSSYDEKDCDFFDFYDDSIEKFIEELEKEQEKAEDEK
ncbi:MAG: hypothetical protein PHQ42_02790 [Patescibacteria group bacterium]|nr:hypothetical protein [Patescibacteria group bacterium]